MRTSALVGGAAAVNLALAGALPVLLVAGDEGEPRDMAALLGDVALVALWALPAVVALVGRDRLLFLVAAAVLALLVVPATFSLSLLMVVPAALYVAAAATSDDRPEWAGGLAALAVVVLGAAAGVIFFALTEGRCWEYEVRADGTTASRTVPTEGRWEPTNGGVGGSGGPHVIGAGSDVVEAGGGCKDRTTLAGAILALVLVSVSAGLGVLGRCLHSPA